MTVAGEPVEGTVELVCLNDHVVTLGGEYGVRTIVLGDSPQESVAIHRTLVQQVCCHTARGRLAVCACHAQSFVCTCQRSQYLGTFLDFETALTEELEFLMLGGDGRGVDDQRAVLVFTGQGDEVCVFLIMHLSPFLFQASGQVAGGTVIAAHHDALVQEIAGNGTHADASDSYEIYCFDVHCLFLL